MDKDNIFGQMEIIIKEIF